MPKAEAPSTSHKAKNNHESDSMGQDRQDAFARLPPILPTHDSQQRPDFDIFRSRGVLGDGNLEDNATIITTRGYPRFNSKESSVIDDIVDRVPLEKPQDLKGLVDETKWLQDEAQLEQIQPNGVIYDKIA